MSGRWAKRGGRTSQFPDEGQSRVVGGREGVGGQLDYAGQSPEGGVYTVTYLRPGKSSYIPAVAGDVSKLDWGGMPRLHPV